MNPTLLVGVLLVAGFVFFLTGAVRWRLVYQAPPAEALVAIHTDQLRRAWIHLWILVGIFVTTSGLAALILVLDGAAVKALAAVAATVYLLGAVCWVVSLAFRLTVVPWAAKVTVTDGQPPNGFDALDGWAGALYGVHMTAAYAAFALLGASILGTDLLSAWLGWLGVALGFLCLTGLIATRYAGPFNPPILAHSYTAVVGVMLLLA